MRFEGLTLFGGSVIFIGRACFTSLEQGKKVKSPQSWCYCPRVFPHRRAWAWDGFLVARRGWMKQVGW